MAIQETAGQASVTARAITQGLMHVENKRSCNIIFRAWTVYVGKTLTWLDDPNSCMQCLRILGETMKAHLVYQLVPWQSF